MNLPKNNESTTVKSDASELGLPTPEGAALANVGAKIVNKSECVKRLGELFDYINQKSPVYYNKALFEYQFVHDLSKFCPKIWQSQNFVLSLQQKNNPYQGFVRLE